MTRLFRRTLSGEGTHTVKVLAAALLGGMALLSGCSKEDDPGDSRPTAVEFRAKIQATDGGSGWTAADKVGIFMLTTGGSLGADIVGAGSADAADNREYGVTPATGALTPAGRPIHYPESGNVDFIAYYPYSGATGEGPVTTDYTYAISVAGQTTEAAQRALDVLYVKKSDAAKSKTVVDLTFGHVLSKVTLHVTLGEGIPDKVTTAVLSGMPQSATMALQNGTLTAGAIGDFHALKAASASDGAPPTFKALLVPQTGGTGRAITFTVDGTDYVWAIPDDEIFAAGNHYTYPVTLKLTGVEVGTPTIIDWNTNDHGSGSVDLSVVRIPAKGKTFLMGSSDGTNPEDANGTGLNATPAEPNRSSHETQHRVTFTEDFRMSKYQVTNAEYAAFLNAEGIGNPATATVGSYGDQTLIVEYRWSLMHDGGKWKAQEGYENHPVIFVTWYGAYAYAEWAGGFLPTEAQWEFACRGGKEQHPFGIGTGYELTNTLANFCWEYSWSWNGVDVEASNGPTGSGYPSITQAVGNSAITNGYGLYDMHGNVYEWCMDQWDGSENYPSLPQTDPLCTSGPAHILRGGYWGSYGKDCRSASRSGEFPHTCNGFIGIRVAFAP